MVSAGLLIEALILAQDDGPMRMWLSLLPLAAIGVLFYLMLIRPERQKQATHQALLSNLKKNDRVVTIGGIKGIVTNVQRDADDVTINVDESSGTKLHVTVASIARVERVESKGDAKKK